MQLGVEAVAHGAHPFDALAGEDRLHLLEHAAQPVGGLHLQRSVDAVDRLDPVEQQPLGLFGDPALHFLRRALAVVLEVGAGAQVALVVGRRRLRSASTPGRAILRRGLGLTLLALLLTHG